MKILAIPLLLLSTACTGYVLPHDATPDEKAKYRGTVISVEADKDFVMEVSGQLLFVDNDAHYEVELGDRLIVYGHIDNDLAEGEAPELDAERVRPWIVK